MNLTKKMGDKGEDLTAKYLRERGFIITKRNFHSRYGEIDIIAENAQYILFVEVKTRKNNAFVSGFSAVDIHKRRKIIATAEEYLSKSLTELQPRFDVAEITVFGEKERTEYKMNYIENAFSSEG
ncbi:MAG: YraN family protein [Clostridia bacterium]|nr:YraN family protein [Clostridia bacterium]